MNRLTLEKRVRVISALVEGTSINATVADHVWTVEELLGLLGKQVQDAA